MKMYILVRESLPIGHAILAAAHASLACYLKFKDAPEVATWLSGPFKKVICKVTDAEFERATKLTDTSGALYDHVVMTESALENAEVAIAFRPRADDQWDKSFKFLRLYR